MTQKVRRQQLAAQPGSTEAECLDSGLPSMDLVSLQCLSTQEWCGKGWRVPTDVVPRGDAMR